MGGDRQRLPVWSYEHAVTSAIMTPVNTVLLRHGLELRDVPVMRISPHGGQQLRCRVHVPLDDTAGSITPQRRTCLEKFARTRQRPTTAALDAAYDER